MKLPEIHLRLRVRWPEIRRNCRNFAKKCKKIWKSRFFVVTLYQEKGRTLNTKLNKIKNTDTMKAIKLYNIIWNTECCSQSVAAKLPEYKCFTTKDDEFDVVTRCPGLLQKKYGCPVVRFSYSVMKVLFNIEDVLKLFIPQGAKEKKIFKVSGELSEYGNELYKELRLAVHRRKKMEDAGVSVAKIPAVLDEVMIGISNITGIDWEACTEEEIMKEIEQVFESIKDEMCEKAEIEKARIAAMRKKVRRMNKLAAKAAAQDEDEDDDEEGEGDEDDDRDYED